YYLTCTVDRSAWGIQGNSIISALGLADSSSNEPLSEAWFGAHHDSPSTVEIDQRSVPLNDLIAKHPEEILGKRVHERFGASLPFRFKILSVGRSLSLQLHPDAEWAAKLNSEFPHLYPDPQHKPEIGIAITDVRILCGFRSADEVNESIRSTPELKDLLG